jgi:ferric-dicitrate binding protein FerR (iron transport regulator)
MMPPPTPPDRLPPRLAGGAGPVADLLRRYLRQGVGPDDGPAWDRLMRSMAHRDRRSRARLAVLASSLGALAGAAAVAAIAMNGHWTSAPSAPVAALPAPAAPAISPEPAAPPPTLVAGPAPVRVALGKLARPLPSGEFDLDGRTVGQLSPRAIARARNTGRGLHLELVHGRLRLQVAARDADRATPAAGRRPVQVIVGVYRFVVLSSAFRVQRESDGVRLAVEQGQVDVYRSDGPRDRRLALVSAGQSWMKAEGCPRRPSAQSRLACWQAQARGQGLAAEIAAYELGRLQRDVLANPAAALEAFQACRLRFPLGSLRPEVDLSIVELLPVLGRYQQALDESAALLAASPGAQRRAELHRLRGDVYRDGLGDTAQAQREYALAGAQ